MAAETIKEKPKTKRQQLRTVSQSKKRIEEIGEEMHSVSLEIFKVKGIYGPKSKEHLALREKLHKLNDERVALGYSKDNNVTITDEDKEAIRQRNAERKRQREEKRNGGEKIKRIHRSKEDDE